MFNFSIFTNIKIKNFLFSEEIFRINTWDFFNNFFFINFFKKIKSNKISNFNNFIFYKTNIFSKNEISYFYFNNFILEKTNIFIKLFNFFSINFFNYLFIYFFVLFLVIVIFDFNFFFFEEKKNFFFLFFSKFSLIWLKFFSEKLESFEEAFLSFKFLHFFLFIFFSHIFFLENLNNIFIFIEWNLPVIFGLLIIFENIYFFSSFVFIYLNGSKTRNLFIFSLFEDLINLFILITRIFLQMIRGLICSFYHDFFREISIFFFLKLQNFFFVWNLLFNFNLVVSFYNFFLFLLYFFFYIFILTFSVVLMFLQALFLFLAIWLFCKCWFISTNYSFINLQNKSIFNKINFIKNLN